MQANWRKFGPNLPQADVITTGKESKKKSLQLKIQSLVITLNDGVRLFKSTPNLSKFFVKHKQLFTNP